MAEPSKSKTDEFRTGEVASLLVRLHGKRARDGRIPIEDLALLVTAMHTSLTRMASRRLEDRPSLRPGPRTKARSLVEVYLRAVKTGSTVLEFEVGLPQRTLEGQRMHASLVGDWVAGLSQLKADTPAMAPGFDRGVLQAVHTMESLLARDTSRIEFMWQDGQTKTRAVFDADARRRIEALIARPASNLRTIAGIILQVDFHAPEVTFTLYTEGGEAVPCAGTEEDLSAVLNGILQAVRVSGDAREDPETGKILSLRADSIERIEGSQIYRFPLTAVREFWTGVEVDTLQARQGVVPFDPEEIPAWDAPSAEEMERYLQVLKPRRQT